MDFDMVASLCNKSRHLYCIQRTKYKQSSLVANCKEKATNQHLLKTVCYKRTYLFNVRIVTLEGQKIGTLCIVFSVMWYFMSLW